MEDLTEEEQVSGENQGSDINEKEKTNFKNLSYSKRDVYYRKAKEEGFRARSVYKLKEINNNFEIFKGSSKIVDLCAAPGSWSQMVRIITKANPDSHVVSVDIQDIVPIEGVTLVKGDITKQETIENILANFAQEKVDIVIFDGAPDVTGLIEVDMYMQVQLIISSLIICMKLLRRGGKFTAKIFKERKGIKSDFYYDKVKLLFDNVFTYKPASSRNTSHENFLVCEGYGLSDPELEKLVDMLSIEQIYSFKDLPEKSALELKLKQILSFLIGGDYNCA